MLIGYVEFLIFYLTSIILELCYSLSFVYKVNDYSQDVSGEKGERT